MQLGSVAEPLHLDEVPDLGNKNCSGSGSIFNAFSAAYIV
jgi:hypothetical protein